MVNLGNLPFFPGEKHQFSTKDDISSHLSAFALDRVAEVPLAELTRCQKVLLTFAKAFWPRAPHVLFVPLGGENQGKNREDP